MHPSLHFYGERTPVLIFPYEQIDHSNKDDCREKETDSMKVPREGTAKLIYHQSNRVGKSALIGNCKPRPPDNEKSTVQYQSFKPAL